MCIDIHIDTNELEYQDTCSYETNDHPINGNIDKHVVVILIIDNQQ